MRVRTRTIKVATANAGCCTEVGEGVLLATSVPPTNHLVGVLALLKLEVILLQEVLEEHVPHLAKALGMAHYRFVPMNFISLKPGERNRFGLAVLSKYEITDERVEYYAPFADDQPQMWNNWQDYGFEGERLTCALHTFTVLLPDGTEFRLGNTHFTWSMRGKFSRAQRQALPKLMRCLGLQGDLVWFGDLNLPRGTSRGWDILARVWRDNVPASFRTSLDLHTFTSSPPRPTGLERMIDVIWSVPTRSRWSLRRVAWGRLLRLQWRGILRPWRSRYTVGRVAMYGGASDHMVFATTITVWPWVGVKPGFAPAT